MLTPYIFIIKFPKQISLPNTKYLWPLWKSTKSLYIPIYISPIFILTAASLNILKISHACYLSSFEHDPLKRNFCSGCTCTKTVLCGLQLRTIRRKKTTWRTPLFIWPTMLSIEAIRKIKRKKASLFTWTLDEYFKATSKYFLYITRLVLEHKVY